MQSVPQALVTRNVEGFLDRVHSELRTRVRDDQYRAWFRDLSLIELQAETVEFGVRSGFVRDWLTRNFMPILKLAARTASELDQLDVRVSLDQDAVGIAATDPMDPTGAGVPLSAAAAATSIAPMTADEIVAAVPQGAPSQNGGGGISDGDSLIKESDAFDAIVEGTGLNQGYTFETFVVGDCNRLSHAAAIAIGENPGCAYNPLFIHGNTGLGKTHLLQATCQAILQKRRGAKVSYLSCEDFTNRYIRAIQDRSLDEFRRIQRGVDVLVIDDVQFLANKERTQEEFFHTFNELYNSQSQIVISSDRSPQEIPMIEERLVSRFKWGLVAEMEAPSLETRIAIVKRKSSALGVDMSEEIAFYIAERMDKNIRELEGAVIKVVSMMSLTGQDLGTELAADALRGVIGPRKTPASAQDIMKMIAEEYSITVRDMTGKGRTQTVSLPRQIAMFLTRKLTDLSLEEIGRNYGNRDHTTVLYAVQKIEKRIGEDRRFRETIDTLTSRLQCR